MRKGARLTLWTVLLGPLGLIACGGSGTAPSGAAAAASQQVPAEAQVRPGLIELRRWQEPQQRVVIDRAGAVIGPLGEPMVRKLFVEPERLNDLLFFLRTYAPFRLRSGTGELAFGGQGSVRPGTVEQRMIFEWARKVTAEMNGSPDQDAYGLLVAWHRGGEAGVCDDVAVYLDGEVRAGSCAWPDESRGRLRPELLARLDRWYDELKPFQQASGVEGGQGQVPVRLTFAGRGSRDPSPQDFISLHTLAAALHRELALRRGGAAPPQPAAPPEAGEPPNQEAPAAETPGPALLLPPAPPARLPLPRAVLPPYIQPPPIPSP